MRKQRPLEELPDVLQVEDVMGFLQIGRNTIYQMLRSGQLPSIRIGRQYRIPKKILLSYLEEKCYNSDMEGSPDHNRKGDVSQ